MRFLLFIAVCFCCSQSTHAHGNDSAWMHDLPDTVKAVSFITDVTVSDFKIKKEFKVGIGSSLVSLALEADKKEREVEFRFPSTAKVIATGLNIEKEKDELEWTYDWKPNTAYKLLIVSAGDSADNFVLYSAYVFLPELGKWKLIGTCRIDGEWGSMKGLRSFYDADDKKMRAPVLSNTWIQRSNSTWRKLSADEAAVRPLINPMPSLDSVAQYQMETAMIENDIAKGKTDVAGKIEGVFYKIIDAGNGKPVSATDTVTVRYRLTMYNGTDVIDQTKEKPAVFPLTRLIKAWQLAIPLVKTGGKIKLVIPSGFAYSIRTRSSDIPPNSMLEFVIEVLDTKPATK